ncbi:MAG: sulfatase-like hydrolase/transferase, partial [Sandaracinaceae bacterium]|nr:sulfatase-like hydrolase/transferase [Sandaracinaceae bacterium]
PTPALAALARRSVVFEHAIAPSNGTFPSVASMMAMAPVSQAELDVRQRFWQGRLRDERQTVAEAMRAAGRATFWVGHDHKSCFSDAIAGLEQGFERRRLVPQEPGRDEDADARIAELAIEEIARARAAAASSAWCSSSARTMTIKDMKSCQTRRAIASATRASSATWTPSSRACSPRSTPGARSWSSRAITARPSASTATTTT